MSVLLREMSTLPYMLAHYSMHINKFTTNTHGLGDQLFNPFFSDWLYMYLTSLI